jgi:hypothetical protein
MSAAYRRRLRREAPRSLKLVAWLLAPLLGTGLGVALAILLNSGETDLRAWAIFGSLAGLSTLLLLPAFLARWVWRIDFRQEK